MAHLKKRSWASLALPRYCLAYNDYVHHSCASDVTRMSIGPKRHLQA